MDDDKKQYEEDSLVEYDGSDEIDIFESKAEVVEEYLLE